jgi:transketolase
METRIPTRDAYGKKLIELGYKIPNLVVLDSDLSNSTRTGYFQREFPDRHFNMGIAEANMMLFAAGLSLSGKTVFASSFAMFATGRAWEMIRNTIAHDRMNVKIVASHAGISVGEDGYSHQANEDIAIMRAIPNLEIYCPADAIETDKIIEYAATTPKPMYIRLSREAFPVFLDPEKEFVPGKGQVLMEGEKATVIAAGSTVYSALKAGEKLKEQGIDVRVVNMASIKPIDRELVLESARKTGKIFTCEEHSIIGGLGSAVTEALIEEYPVPVFRMGIPDTFGESGKPKELFKFFNLTTDDIVEKVKANL